MSRWQTRYVLEQYRYMFRVPEVVAFGSIVETTSIESKRNAVLRGADGRSDIMIHAVWRVCLGARYGLSYGHGSGHRYASGCARSRGRALCH